MCCWGKLLSINDTSGKNIGAINPFRYRGYYYDTETGLYYLQSRYYDPNTGRFLNADDEDSLTATPMGLTDKNLYSYCDNNPVMRADENGHIWLNIVVGAVCGAAFSVGWQMIVEHKSIKKIDWVDVGTSAISGALAATGLGIGWQVGLNAALGGAQSLISNRGFDLGDFSASVIAGAVSAKIGGEGFEHDEEVKLIRKTLRRESRRVNRKYARKVIRGAKSMFRRKTRKAIYKSAFGSSSARIGYYGYKRIRRRFAH